MINKEKFYTAIRASKLLGSTLSASEVQGIESILAATSDWPVSHIAYALATAYHETATTMQPIMERGGYTYYENMYGPTGKNPTRAKKNGNTSVGDGAKFCGRGYVQLTWYFNYLAMSSVTGVDLVANPDLAMQPDIAAKILEFGMRTGKFTGKKLKDYLPNNTGTLNQFTGSRRIINGMDKAAKIAEYAIIFQKALLQE